MIEVPARVKDALKSGDYRKNYKITLQEPILEDEDISGLYSVSTIRKIRAVIG